MAHKDIERISKSDRWVALITCIPRGDYENLNHDQGINEEVEAPKLSMREKGRVRKY